MIASSVCHQVGIYVGIQELRRFVDGFLVGVSLDLGERLDGELGRNIVDRLHLACLHGWFVLLDPAYNQFK